MSKRDKSDNDIIDLYLSRNEKAIKETDARCRQYLSTVISMSSSVNPSCPYNTTVVAYGTREVFVSGVHDGSYYFVHKGTKSTGSDLGSFSCDWFSDGLYIY